MRASKKENGWVIEISRTQDGFAGQAALYNRGTLRRLGIDPDTDHPQATFGVCSRAEYVYRNAQPDAIVML